MVCFILCVEFLRLLPEFKELVASGHRLRGYGVGASAVRRAAVLTLTRLTGLLYNSGDTIIYVII